MCIEVSTDEYRLVSSDRVDFSLEFADIIEMFRRTVKLIQ